MAALSSTVKVIIGKNLTTGKNTLSIKIGGHLWAFGNLKQCIWLEKNTVVNDSSRGLLEHMIVLQSATSESTLWFLGWFILNWPTQDCWNSIFEHLFTLCLMIPTVIRKVEPLFISVVFSHLLAIFLKTWACHFCSVFSLYITNWFYL